MKSLIIKSLAASVLALAACSYSFAQTRDIEHDFTEFDAISATSDFKVTFSENLKYGAKLTVEDDLQDYVDCYVKGNCLYVGLREKDIPKEVKKAYKAKNAQAPILNVTVYAPKLNSITLADGCTFSTNSGLNADKFTVDLGDNSSIQNLTVNSNSVVVKAAKKASVVLMAKSEDVEINGDGDAVIRVDCSGTKSLKVNNNGSANVNVNGTFEEAAIDAENSSQLTVSGSTNNLTITGKGNRAKVDAGSFSTPQASLQIAGPTVTVAVTDALELELGKGSNVTYAGSPVINIVSVENSSIYRKK
jgi:hypothetical protein